MDNVPLQESSVNEMVFYEFNERLLIMNIGKFNLK